MIIYTVKSGEDLKDVARRFNISINEIMSDNDIVSPLNVTEGQLIFIPTPCNELLKEKEKIKTITSVKPNLDEKIALRLVRDLTYISIRSGFLRRDGSLCLENDGKLKALARSAKALPILEISPSFIPSKHASEDFFSPDMTLRIAHNIKNAILSNGYRGINLNLRGIYSGKFDIYTELVSALKSMLCTWNIDVFATVDEKNILLDDIELRCDAVDFISIFPKSDGEELADVLRIEDLLRILCEVSDPNKISLCLPMSANDCSMPLGENSRRCDKFSTAQAMRLAMECKASIFYDNATCLSQFEYFDMELGKLVKHNVVFESLESLQEIVFIGVESGVGIFNVFNADKYYTPFWKMLSELYDVEKLN